MYFKKKKLYSCATAILLAVTTTGITLPPMTASAITAGDVNADGTVSTADVRLLQSWLTGRSAARSDWTAADLNGDALLNAVDLTLLKRMLLNQPDEIRYIHLRDSGITYEGSHITVNGKIAVIDASGTYYLDGNLSNGQVVVQIADETVDAETVKLFLNGVSMTNPDAPCILVENAENTSVNLVEGTVNTLTDGKEPPAAEVEPTFAVLEAKDDMTIKGSGSLTVTAGVAYGIHCNNDLKLNEGAVTVETGNGDAVRGRTSVTVKNGSWLIDSEGDGIKSTKGLLEVIGGTVRIKSGKDALQAETEMSLTGGSVQACGDRGLKAGGTITLDGCTLLATATDNPCENLGTPAQPSMQLTFVKEWAKNNPLTLTDASGQTCYEQNALKKYRYAVVSSPELNASADYSLWAGGIQVGVNGNLKFRASAGADYTAVNNTDTAALLYDEFFNQQRVHKIEVLMPEATWTDFLAHSQDEEYYPCDIVIDGETYENVGIRTKGHSSNMFVYQAGKDKYSFRIKMDKYDKYQNYHGLTEFCMNNMYSDPSCMRDILCYNAMETLDAYVPNCAYTNMYLNGALYSFYLLAEQPGTTLGERLATNDDAVLYKAADVGNNYDCTFAPDMALNNFEVKFGTDDNLTHISEVVTAINQVTPQNYQFIEEILDVPSFLKGLAVNAVLCNYDSYNGQMSHNFYVEYNNGKMYYVGWDYNLSLGNFMDYGASVNSDINTGMYNADTTRRPLLTKLLAVPEYKTLYNTYVREIVAFYEDPEATVNGFAALIRSHVQADPRSFFTPEQFESNIAKSPQGLQISGNGGMGGMWGGGMWGGGMWGGGMWGGGSTLFSYGGDQVSIVDFMIKRNEVILSTLN